MALALGDAPVVLIDGPSGAGKSVLARTLVDQWPSGTVELVRMDDVYPGWSGLASGSELLHAELLAPLRAAGVGRWRRWDWAGGKPAEAHEVAAGHPLVVEGCGCLSGATAPLADLRVWLTADDDVRKIRALSRDAGEYDTYWDLWQEQWERFVSAESPADFADVVIDTTFSFPADR